MSSERRIKSILSELGGFGLTKPDEIIETRVENLISSIVYINRLIEETFTEEESDNLKRRLMLSLKNEDNKQFARGLKLIKESKNGSK